RMETHYRPYGVVAGIAPWNFPLCLLTLKLAAATPAGNTFVAKPVPTTPVTIPMVGELAQSIFPAGVRRLRRRGPQAVHTGDGHPPRALTRHITHDPNGERPMATWLITGASRGFGLEIARQALGRGDAVVATARDPRSIPDALPGFGDRLLATTLD